LIVDDRRSIDEETTSARLIAFLLAFDAADGRLSTLDHEITSGASLLHSTFIIHRDELHSQ
jgi:primosomal replication protein N